MPLLVTCICGFARSTIARRLLAHQPDLQIIGLDSWLEKYFSRGDYKKSTS